MPAGKGLNAVVRLRRWMALTGTTEGPLFQSLWRGGRLRGRRLHHSDIPRLVKHYVEAIGLDPAEYSGHSLRAGFVTSAAVHGARLDKIMEVTRHSSAEMVLRYIRQVEAFDDHAGAAFL
ncbi:MAG: tyrosine-type recombinase/integrase [Acidobacteria bacterium]|nr:tyrosine-type recombinase/integrase [Acidobacteriota bacterium]